MRAHGTAVGLPTEDDMGNSEVGHNALGAGRIFAQGYLSVSYLNLFFDKLMIVEDGMRSVFIFFDMLG